MSRRRDERAPFADVVRQVGHDVEVTGSPEDPVAEAPDGTPLAAPRRMTVRGARPWTRRDDTLLGRWPCGGAVEWLDGPERDAFATRLRTRSRDCNPAGDVLLYRLPDGRRALVLQS